ncbi:MAG: A24 family peptidase [archaeon]
MLQLIQQAILLIGTATGAVTDAKTGYIYDWITYPMIALGAILAITQQQWINLELGVVVFGLLYLAYKFGKLGGGDVKLFTAIALLNPTNNPMYFFTIMFFAAISATIFYSVYYTSKYLRSGGEIKENKNGIIKAIVLGAVIVIYFTLLSTYQMISVESAILLATPLMFGIMFIAFQEGIRKKFFEAKITIGKLEEDEVIAEGRNNNKIMKIMGNKQLIGEKEKTLLKKAGVKAIYVLRKLPPFAPFILVGVIGAIAYPDFLFFIFI